MPLSVNIKSIDRRGGATYIVVGKTEYEVAGGLVALRQFVRDRVRSIDPLTLACLRLAVHLQADPSLQDVSQLIGKTDVLSIGGNEVS